MSPDYAFSFRRPPATDATGVWLCGGSACIQIPNEVVWVFLGDSITDAQYYTAYVESYFHLRYPHMTFHFRGEGRGGSKIPEVIDVPPDGARYDRRVYSWLPTHVSSMFGHNGAYSNAEFLQQIDDLTDDHIIAQNAATTILWGAHPTHTATGKPTLGGYSDQIVTFGTQRGLLWCDVWHEMQPIFAANVADPSPVDLGYGTDTVHPGPAGHLVIAWTLLRQMHVIPDVSAVVIDAATPAVLSTSHATISGLTTNAFNGIDFVRLDDRLPMAWDDAARVAGDLVTIYEKNLYLLTVHGLSAGTYDIYVDGVDSANVTHTQLAAGWNMTEMTAGPIYDQLIEVLGRIRDKEGVTRADPSIDVGPPFVGVRKYKSNADALYDSGDGLTGAALAAALATNRAECVALDALIRAAAQPVARTFSLRKQ